MCIDNENILIYGLGLIVTNDIACNYAIKEIFVDFKILMCLVFDVVFNSNERIS